MSAGFTRSNHYNFFIVRIFNVCRPRSYLYLFYVVYNIRACSNLKSKTETEISYDICKINVHGIELLLPMSN